MSVFLLTLAANSITGAVIPTDLRVEAMTEPTVDRERPAFSWKLEAVDPDLRNLSQSAYRILVATDPARLEPGKADLWDSGQVRSSSTYGIEYGGKRLTSGLACWWSIQAWDQDGTPSDWSKAARFSMGLLQPGDWKAKWISVDAPETLAGPGSHFYGAKWIWSAKDPEKDVPAGTRVFTKRFTTPPQIDRATLVITVDDQFKAFINGREVASSDGKTDAWRRPVSVDPKPYLRPGENEIRIEATNASVGSSGTLAKLIIQPPTTRGQEIVTDETWQADGERVRVIGDFGCAPWGTLGARTYRGATYYRKGFEVRPKLKRATAYTTALGLVDLHLNGKRVSEDLFTPGWTNYDTRIYYRAYDVTHALKPGDNAVAAILGDGWYSGYIGYAGVRDQYGDRPQLLVQLELEYEDGSKEIVATDKTWKATAFGSIVQQDFLAGEDYDARLEQRGWDRPGFDDRDWLWAEESDLVVSGGTPSVSPAASHLPPSGGGAPSLGSSPRPDQADQISPSPAWEKGPGDEGDAGHPVREHATQPGPSPVRGEVDARSAAGGGSPAPIQADQVSPSPSWEKGPGEEGDAQNPVFKKADQGPKLQIAPHQPVLPYQRLKPKWIKQLPDGKYLVDFGQNLAGFASIKVKGEPGQKITLRFGEWLNRDGTLYTTNLRAARATDSYICSGTGTESWEPRFTFHGFQYVEISGLAYEPKPEDIEAVAISSATPEVGWVETSDPLLNKLVSNAWWTQKMNFIDIPTDCPQRDERLGWTGDAQAYIGTAAMYSDIQPFFTKWLVDLDDAQRADGQYPMVAPLKVAENDGGPAWADAGVICPWTIYELYGDKRQLAEHYPNMKRFVEFCRARSKPGPLPPDKFHCFGDWLSINAETPHDVIYLAYFAGSTQILAKAAKALGNGEDAKEYEALARQIKESFNKAYVSSDGKVKGETQCSYVLALAFDLLDPETAKRTADHLIADIEKRGWHLSTGFVGTRDLMHVLTKIGRNDVAFRLLHQTTFPSWKFEILQGASSIWERWDSWTEEKGFQDPGMNSFAHYAYGAVMEWVFQQVGGIQRLSPGYEKILIAPQIDPNLTWSKTRYDSVRGSITTSWRIENGALTLEVTIPPNATAEVRVPGEAMPRQVGSGSYRFETPWPTRG